MKSNNIQNKALYVILCGFSGAVTAIIVWSFLRLMNICIEFIWHYVPEQLDFRFYPVAVCGIGGLLIGIYQQKTGVIPEDLQTVIGKVRKDKFYAYDKVALLCISAFLPLIFGGSIGPEAGLTGVIVGLCYWARDNMNFAKENIDNLTEVTMNSAFTAIFIMPLFGVSAIDSKRVNVYDSVTEKKLSDRVSNIVAIFCSFGTLILMNKLFGGSAGLPKITEFDITIAERLWGIPLAIVGVVAAYIFIVFEELTKKIFDVTRCKFGIITSSTAGGIILGIAGTFLPFVMFSGEEGIVELENSFGEYLPIMLIVIGVTKLFMTNVCINSGWKGGHFFPVIFCAVSIGFGIGMMADLNLEFCAAVVTGGLLGTIMNQPLMLCILLVVIFDLRMLFWIVIAILVGTLGRKVLNRIKAE